jgi:hypothetical protein
VELWRGTVEVGPREQRRLVVTDSSLELSDPNGVMPPVVVDLHEAASNGVLLVFSTTMTAVQGRGPNAKRLQLRAIAPSTFDGIDWPDDVAEAIEAQRERDRQSSLALRRQLGRVVAITISVLAVLLVVLVLVLLLA